MPIIVQSLRDMAIERTVSNSNVKAAAAAKAAAEAAKAPAAELTASVNRVATCLGGVYFLTSLGNPTLDPFRCDRIDIYSALWSCSLLSIGFNFIFSFYSEFMSLTEDFP